MKTIFGKVVVCSIIAILQFSPSFAGASLLQDEFTGNSLDTSLWAIVDGGSGVHVSGGILEMSSGPDHKRINSITAFNPGSSGVSVTGRINLNGDYQKFGFNVNGEYPANNIGVYFDSWDDSSGENQDSVRALVVDRSLGSLLLSEKVAVGWGSFHDLSINWLPDSLKFYIDGSQVAQLALAVSGNLPVGIWNDRGWSMQTDSVTVSAVPLPASIWLFLSGIGVLTRIKNKHSN